MAWVDAQPEVVRTLVHEHGFTPVYLLIAIEERSVEDAANFLLVDAA